MPKVSAVKTSPFKALPQVRANHVEQLERSAETNPDYVTVSYDKACSVESVIAVGANYDAKTGFGLPDSYYVEHALFLISHFGLPRAPKVRIDIANLTQKFDYLSPDQPYQADLVLLCLIPAFGFTHAGTHPSLRVSNHGNAPSVWCDRIQNRKPKIVLSVEQRIGSEEITLRDLKLKGYQTTAVSKIEFNYPRIGSMEFLIRGAIRDDIAQKLPASKRPKFRAYSKPLTP